MALNRQGSSKLDVGPWSLAVAKYFDSRIKNDPLRTRDKVAKAVGIAQGRLPYLLRGDRRWYLEDVERMCRYFNLDFIGFLEELESTLLSVPSSSVPDLSQIAYGLVAHHQNDEIGNETDEGFDSP